MVADTWPRPREAPPNNKFNELFDILILVLNRPFNIVAVGGASVSTSGQCSSGQQSGSVSSSFEKFSSLEVSSVSVSGSNASHLVQSSSTGGAGSQEVIKGEEEIADIVTAITGLETIILKHFFKSIPLVGLKAFKILLDHLTNHYLADPRHQIQRF